LAVSEHLFRQESGRLVAALTRLFGVQRLALAEDVAQHAFCRALEVWKVRGIPENPSAWLLATAKHRALDLLRRERTVTRAGAELERAADRAREDDAGLESLVEQAFLPAVMRDEQLRMMFSCCPPALPPQSQIALILNILCGFGAAEIASSLLEGRAAVEKRLSRGKNALARKRSLFELDGEQIAARLDAVRRALYLLFNEGYHGASSSCAVRPELCDEALRLTALLLEYGPTATPTTHALLATMCLNAARLPARIDEAGDLLGFFEQDRSRWDARLVEAGLSHFERSQSGLEVSAFHVEAAIAVAHASAPSQGETDWEMIVELYERLLRIQPSPVIALNRAIALAERDGPERALEELGALPHADRLRSYPFYHATLAELELRRGNHPRADSHFAAALRVARNDAERRFLNKRRSQAHH
jgi:RNA polymerase sigma factor (sigma-70 family)